MEKYALVCMSARMSNELIKSRVRLARVFSTAFAINWNAAVRMEMQASVYVCVNICVWQRERERERETRWGGGRSVYTCQGADVPFVD